MSYRISGFSNLHFLLCLLAAWSISSHVLDCKGPDRALKACRRDGSLKMLPFPKPPHFDRCSYHSLKQRAGSLVAREVAEESPELFTTDFDLSREDILHKIATTLDPLRGDLSVANAMFSGALENLTSLDLSDCPSRPEVPSGVLHAKTIDEITFRNLIRLTVWYHKPLLFFSVADTPEKDTLRRAFLDVAADYSDQLILILADTQELYKYSVSEHRNLLSGKVVSYYLTHALRTLRPQWSSNFEPLSGSMQNPKDVRSAITKLLKEEREEQKTAPTCSNHNSAGRARTFAGDFEDSLKPFRLLIEEGGPSTDPTEKYLGVPRASRLSPLDFLHRYFLKGMPVVVTDAMKGWDGLGKWNRKWLFKTYKKHIKNDGFSDDESGAGNWVVASKKVQNKLRKGYGLPYFFNLGCPSDLTGDKNISAKPPPTSEYFYHSPGTGYAVLKHLDTSCHQTYSAQLEGKKQWILWPPENDKLRRKPMATVMTPGDIMVFYSGWFHATRNIEDKPSLAMSAYLSHPVPSTFLWDNQEFLLNQRQYATCGTMWKIQTGLPFWENANFSRFATD